MKKQVFETADVVEIVENMAQLAEATGTEDGLVDRVEHLVEGSVYQQVAPHEKVWLVEQLVAHFPIKDDVELIFEDDASRFAWTEFVDELFSMKLFAAVMSELEADVPPTVTVEPPSDDPLLETDA